VTRSDDHPPGVPAAADAAGEPASSDADEGVGPSGDIDDGEIASFEEEKTSPEVRARPQRSDDARPVAVVALVDPRRRRRVVELLRGDGWNAVEATDVDELVEMVKTLGAQVVLADADLRRGDVGIASVLRHHRHDAAQRLVALVRTESESDGVARVLADGFDDFVSVTSDDGAIAARANANLRVARTVAELNKQKRDASLLLELTQTLASSLDIGLILHTVSRLISEVLGLERCSIILFDPASDDAVMVAASDDRTVRDLRIKLSEYPELKLCVESAAPVLIDDVAANPALEHVAKSLVDRGVRKQALFPIVHEEDVIGVLFLRSAKPTLHIGQHEIQFAQTVASACATAIRNARLFDQFRDRHQHIETMRAQAERQTEALKKYQDFFEYAADGIAVIDVDGGIHYVNKEGRRLLGRSWDDLKSLRFPSLLLVESARLWPELVAQVRHGRFRRSFDVYINVSQQERVLSLSAGGVGQGTGLLILSFRDVTELRSMEGELRTTKDFLANLIDNSVDAIVAADMNGNIILFNKGAEKVYGYKAEDVIGVMHVSQLYPDGGAEDVMSRLRDDRWGGRGRLAPERREIRVASGGVVPVSMSASIIYEDGDEVATVGVFTDLRDRMAIERQLSEARDQLTKAEKARVAAELAGMAAHELNQPLTSVLGYAEMLKSRVAESDMRIRRPVETIFQQAERMAEIVRKIGSITKYETKRYGANTDMIDLSRSVDRVPTTDPVAHPDTLRSLPEASSPTVRSDGGPGGAGRVPAPAATPTEGTDFPNVEAPGASNVKRTPTQSFRAAVHASAQDRASTTDAPGGADREQRRTDPPKATPTTSGAPARSDGAFGAFAAMLGTKPADRGPGHDPRHAIVRMDTVDDEPIGYARRLQMAQIDPAQTGPASSPVSMSSSAKALTPQAFPAVGRPPMRSLAFDDIVPPNVEGEQHTNPGVRASELRRRSNDEPPE
jgi:PAS domain S-box-containing protein